MKTSFAAAARSGAFTRDREHSPASRTPPTTRHTGEALRFEIREVREEDTYDLRRRVSADGIELPTWHHELDQTPGARYLGAIARDGRVVGTASLYPAGFPTMPGVVPAVRLMFLAVEPHLQRQGVGRALMVRVIRDLQTEGVQVLWATARDEAIPFYRRLELLVGEPSPSPPGVRSHHYVYLDLRQPLPKKSG